MSGHSHEMHQALQFSNWSWIILLSVLTSSLVGSLHCVGMCGGLIMASAKTKAQMIAYHFGRLFAYVSLGAIAAALGHHFAHQFPIAEIQYLSVALISGLFFWMGYRAWTGQGLHLHLPKFFQNIHFKLWKLLFSSEQRSKDSVFFSASSGVLTAFLPCGWLYSFVLAAATVNTWWKGSLVMLFFWIGTVPALGFSSALLVPALQKLGNHSPKISGALLFFAGFVSIALKFSHHH